MSYDVPIRLMPEVTATFKVAVVREGEGWADAEKRHAAAAAASQAAVEKVAADALIFAAQDAAAAAEEVEGDE